ncbi:MAG: oligosaccharide flippase family protein [Burkholderiales bacterium]|nr:oligosaccharide flippase family protein [Burkholderiales bacterium]
MWASRSGSWRDFLMNLIAQLKKILGNSYFLMLMMLSAGISMSRGFFVAMGLDKAAFIDYATVVSTGYFLSFFLSIGAVEYTVKNFPRMIANKENAKVIDLTEILIISLLHRAFLLIVLTFFTLYFVNERYFIALSIAFILGLLSCLTSVISSLQRSLSKPHQLAYSNLYRAIIVFLFVVPATYYNNFSLVVASEIFSSLLGFFLSCWHSGVKNISIQKIRKSFSVALKVFGNHKDGLLLSVSYLLLSIPFYLDRLVAKSIYPIDESAKYALIAMFMTAGSVLSNTIAQRTGAEAIKILNHDRKIKSAARYIVKWIIFGVLLWSIFMLLVSALFHFDIMPESLKKYDIAANYLVLVYFLGILSFGSIIEFIVIGIDGEKLMLFSSIFYLTLLFILIFIVYIFHLPLVYFLSSLAISKLFYILFIIYSVKYIIQPKT